MERNAIQLVNDFYDEVMFGQTTAQDKLGFLNCGYWKGISPDALEYAQINLLETLAEFLIDRRGTLVDVACGKGASSRFLTKYFEPHKITGINISERQLEVARLLAPHCQFRLMDAVNMSFDDASIDNVICVESAFHFLTRRKFFSEVYRILRPGGRFSISDLLFSQSASDIYPSVFKENYLPDVNAYKEELIRAGFSYVRVEDTTTLATGGLFNAITRRYEQNSDNAQNQRDYQSMLAYAATEPQCCMGFAIK